MSSSSTGSVFGATTSAALPPSSGGTEVTGYLLAPGSVSVVYLDDATTLHARVTSGTTTLYLLRKAVS
jgi:hypothetical protein